MLRKQHSNRTQQRTPNSPQQRTPNRTPNRRNKQAPICRTLRRVPPFIWVLLLFVLMTIAALGIKATQKVIDLSYPLEYTNLVEQYADEYDVDPLLIYSFIRTESGFDPEAQSNVDARGLMQITSDTFDWIKSKIASDEDITFDDMYDPAINIRFGTYYVSRCLSRYEGDVSTAAAAYHSGWGTVDSLLAQSEYSANGLTLDSFPYNQMRNYVFKITTCYEKYISLYE